MKRDATRDEKRATHAAYYVAHREERRVYDAAYGAAHREERRLYNAAYRVANPPKPDAWAKARSALNCARRKTRKYGLDAGSLTKETFARLHLLPCAYCGTMPAMGADHVVPLSKGGPNSLENLVPACLPCNHAKSVTQLAAPVILRAVGVAP